MVVWFCQALQNSNSELKKHLNNTGLLVMSYE